MSGFPALLTDGTEITRLRAPWAPGLHVAFGRWTGALAPVTRLATGKGADMESALAGCLGEMAENLSLGTTAHPAPVRTAVAGVALEARALDLDEAGDLGSEGAACHATPEAARQAAALERVERAALALWFQGRLPARPLALDEAEVAALRQGAAARQLRALRLDLLEGVTVALVTTTDAGGGRIALGSAAAGSARAAGRAALQEALLAEIAWLAPPAHPDHAAALRLDAALRPRLAGLTEGEAAAGPERPALAAEDVLALLDRAGHPAGLADLTLPALGLPVWRCLCPSLPLWRAIRP